MEFTNRDILESGAREIRSWLNGDEGLEVRVIPGVTGPSGMKRGLFIIGRSIDMPASENDVIGNNTRIIPYSVIRNGRRDELVIPFNHFTDLDNIGLAMLIQEASGFLVEKVA